MKQTFYIYLMAVCTLLFAACSDDNLSSPTGGVEGTLSFTVTGEYPAFEQTPETRSNGIGIYDQGKTQWETGDEILVQVRYNEGYDRVSVVLTYQEDGSWSANYAAPNSDKVSEVLAIYQPTHTIYYEGGIIWPKGELGNYAGEYLEGTCTINGNNIQIDFSNVTRDYSRLRIASEVGKTVRVKMNGYYAWPQDKNNVSLDNDVYADAKGNAYLYGSWSASSTLSVTIGDETETFTLPESEDGKSYVIDFRQSINLEDVTRPIYVDDEGDFHYRSSGNQPINITGGNPNVYLYNASVSVTSGPVISITGNASPTIHVVGEDNTVQCTGSSTVQEGAGIYVETGSSVAIQGSSRNDVLMAQASQDGAGIGGYGRQSNTANTLKPCGDITIRNVTVYAYASKNMSRSPSIGSTSTCGTIKIENATVYARGTGTITGSCPAIGSYSSLPNIIISGSDIYAYRGAYNNGTTYTDWIGLGGASGGYTGGDIQATITSTTVNKGKWTGSSEVAEGTAVYGADSTLT